MLNIPPMEWIIPNLIPNPGLVVISGKPGSYKTFFVQWLGLRMSAGLGLFDASTQEVLQRACPMGKVPTLFVEEEMTKQLMRDRAYSLKVPEVGDMFYVIDHGFKFKDEVWRTELLRIIEGKNIKLLIFDPFSSVMGLENENDNAEVAGIMDIIRKIFVKKGLTIIILHHPSKGDGEGRGIRGAGDIEGKVDVHICLDVKGESDHEVKVRVHKNRVADRSTIQEFRMSLSNAEDKSKLRFEYLEEVKDDTSKKRNRDHEKLASEIEGFLTDEEEYEREEIAEGVGQNSSNHKFNKVWSKLLEEKRVLRNGVTKKFHIPLSLPPPGSEPKPSYPPHK